MEATTLTRHEQPMSDYLALWHGEYSKIDSVSDAFVAYEPSAPGGEVHGRDAFEAYVRELRTAFPDFTITVEAALEDAEMVMTEWTGRGTHEGEFNGLPPTGRTFEHRGMSKFVIADGKVQEERMYYDPREIAEQLGFLEE
ncbi:ester cyclase [Salinigranum halophilum]|uniref:ester cyclase n=1 Tax=Salinigranum halophilum TaxID=2565931 RepID=UPI0010A8C683|nr:ester cyclase [Salinigranum halophilum]